jgi:hypothetical protein
LVSSSLTTTSTLTTTTPAAADPIALCTRLQAKQKAEAAKLKEMQTKAAKGGPLLGGGKHNTGFLSSCHLRDYKTKRF